MSQLAHKYIIHTALLYRDVAVLCSPVLCPSLPPLTDGVISYSDPTLGENTVATHTCEAGSALTTDLNTRTCGVTSSGVGDVGVWSGSRLVCAGMGSPNTVPTILIISQGVPVQTSLLYTME